jgi:hypothetical protein
MPEGERTRDPSGIDEPHDVLAADEFAMPAPAERPPDPHSDEAEAHDVLAADEFAMPTRAERAPDPHSDEAEAHDVLAAEEFAMPAADAPHHDGRAIPDPRALVALLLLVALVLRLLRRRRH